MRDALGKRLSLYRLRAKVAIAPRDDLAVLWRRDGEAVFPFIRDPRHPQLGFRAIVPRDEATPYEGSAQYHALRLDCGVPEGGDFGQDRIFALDGDLDELGGVDFGKGCYVGQELTARMKHRGTARKRLLPIATLDGGALPAAETSIAAAGREIGTIQSSLDDRGFALIRLDRLEEASGQTVSAAQTHIRIAKPAWLFA